MHEDAVLVAETCERVFRDCADPKELVLDPERAGWRDALWRALEETGLTTAWAPEAAGGAGASVRAGFEVLRVAGSHAVAVPLADTLVAAWLAARSGLRVPPGRLAVAAPGAPHGRGGAVTLGRGGALSGTVPAVPFARTADRIAVLAVDPDGGGDGERVALVDPAHCAIDEGVSVAGDPLDAVRLDGVRPGEVGERLLPCGEARLVGAASRAMLIAGALQAVLDLSVEYSLERVAFERPIAKFQAVQQNLARLAGEVAAANAAAHSAAWAIERFDPWGDGGGAGGAADTGGGVAAEAVFVEAAAAKVRAGEAAQTGALIAHQVHGALGYAREHVLHRHTHRMWSWRDEFGGESEWALLLGEHFAKLGADGLWPALTAV